MTGLLLAADQVELYPPGGLDGHGWRLPDGTGPSWAGTGNLQLAPGTSNPQGAAGGGRGPHGPARDLTGVLYLPADAEPAEGMTAVIRGRGFILSQVRLVTDPAGTSLTCWAATATSDDTWPDGGLRDG